MLNDGGMNECVQLTSGFRIIENDFTEHSSIDRAIRREDPFTELPHDGFIDGLARLEELMSDLI